MAPSEIRGPDLAGVVADANTAGLEHVVHGESPSQGGWFSDLRDRLVGLRGLLH